MLFYAFSIHPQETLRIFVEAIHLERNIMPNIATVLKEEIVRLARKEDRKEGSKLKKASAQHRRDIAELKRQVVALQRQVALLESKVLSGLPKEVSEEDVQRVRFTAKGLKAQRKRLGFSAEDYASLAGVSLQSIYNWEHGVSQPRKKQVAALVALRGISKKEALARLKQMGKAPGKMARSAKSQKAGKPKKKSKTKKSKK